MTETTGSARASGRVQRVDRLGVQWVAVHLDGLGAQVTTDALPPGEPWVGAIPPAALLSRDQDEPIRGDVGAVPHVRGTGLPWPPEAQVDPERGAGRWPIAHAWAALESATERQWSVDGVVRTLEPADAIISAFSAAVADQTGDDRARPTRAVLVVPNGLTERAQQALLDAAQGISLEVKLLWRPIAAALPWIERHGAELLRSLPPLPPAPPGEASKATRLARSASGRHPVVRAQTDESARRRTVGRLLTLHLGIDGAEATSLALVMRQEARGSSLLPGRHRPAAQHAAPAAGSGQFERLVAAIVPPGAEDWPASTWRFAWGSTAATAAFRVLRAGGSDARTQELQDAWETALTGPRVAPLFAGRLGRPETAEAGGRTAQELLDTASRFHESDGPLLGVVVTGPLAALRGRGRLLAERLLEQSKVKAQHILIEGANLPLGALALGAGSFAARLERGEAGFLDTLPRIQIAVADRGEPVWKSLLLDDDRWVEGGRRWRRDPPLAGIVIRRHSQHLDVNLHHEEYPTVRRVQAPIPIDLPNDLPVRLDVTAEPAQGNAKVEVLPEEAQAFGRHRVLVEWRRMSDTKTTPDTYLQDAFPRAFPPLAHRLPHADKWRHARARIRETLESWPEGTPTSRTLLSNLGKAADRLRDRAPNFFDPKTGSREAAAVSSDGVVGGVGQDELDRLVERLVPRLTQLTPGCDDADKVIRTLGYTSTPHPAFALHLANQLQRRPTALSNAELQAMGWCVRDADAACRLARAVALRLTDPSHAPRYWAGALADVLRFREEATRNIDSSLAENLLAILLRIFKTELAEGRGKIVFRLACLGIVYLLRRRRFDDAFLEPDSPLAVEIKLAFAGARTSASQGSLQLMGGSINLSSELQRLIDYIDRKGHGLPGLAAGDED